MIFKLLCKQQSFIHSGQPFAVFHVIPPTYDKVDINDKVDKLKFDGSDFDLKFPSIDNITDRINCIKGGVRLSKVDVARAFRNLRVVPANAVKLGIKWKDSYYLDGSAVFGWVHGSIEYQLLSNAIVFIMAKKGYHIFAYINDYILVNNIGDAQKVFDSLVHLLHELGVPINQDKLSPLVRS